MSTTCQERVNRLFRILVPPHGDRFTSLLFAFVSPANSPVYVAGYIFHLLCLRLAFRAFNRGRKCVVNVQLSRPCQGVFFRAIHGPPGTRDALGCLLRTIAGSDTCPFFSMFVYLWHSMFGRSAQRLLWTYPARC